MRSSPKQALVSKARAYLESLTEEPLTDDEIRDIIASVTEYSRVLLEIAGESEKAETDERQPIV